MYNFPLIEIFACDKCMTQAAKSLRTDSKQYDPILFNMQKSFSVYEWFGKQYYNIAVILSILPF